VQRTAKGRQQRTYEVVGWDRVRGTARRSQEAINELISESHFVLTLFKSFWESEPGSPWGYTSSTEEELFTGLLDSASLNSRCATCGWRSSTTRRQTSKS